VNGSGTSGEPVVVGRYGNGSSPVIRTAIMAASAAPVDPSYIEAFATSMPVNSAIMV